MRFIPKFCHNRECGYVCTSDSERNVYAHANSFCPACQPMETYQEGDMPLLKSEIPAFKVEGMITRWWRNSRDNMYV